MDTAVLILVSINYYYYILYYYYFLVAHNSFNNILIKLKD